MSYSQFGYSYPPSSQLMVGSQAGSSPGTCCEPTTASEGLATTYDPCILSTYGPRFYPATSYPAEAAPSTIYPSFNSYSVKDGGDPWRGLPPTSYYYADPTLSAYGYGGLDLNSARRKNVTRDSTTTLKAWLNEHRKNPYPTKGEKIMLAIITKMTLTQVSTWFANARRRLKKENKMTWEPRNKIDQEDDSQSADLNDTDRRNDGIGAAQTYPPEEEISPYAHQDQERPIYPTSCEPIAELTPPTSTEAHSPDIEALMSPPDSKEAVVDQSKPKIWSLADTATSKSPPPVQGPEPCSWYSAPTSHPSPPYNPPNYMGTYATAALPTDTPPQTPPNMKVSSLHLSPPNYHTSLTYFGNATGMCAANIPSHVHEDKLVPCPGHVTEVNLPTADYRPDYPTDDYSLHYRPVH
ncbi:iroquois-class homeodomain protein irx-4-like [Centruroides sculpturatus]|uniref:iroquois-class homeodomain protein irx-4-like n=1 Tax=Centruroides sculpturatus TaxID=218467 RepID=UPI000C6D1A97|nr:iroquois-class homeodomain protein irx-4-like [Centruroides sculpturatus]